jgi:CheY-like chemotaxis protein
MDSTAVFFTEKVTLEIIKNLPPVLWFLLVSAIVILFYKPLRYELLPKLSGLKMWGVEFSFVQNAITTAIELAEKSEEFPKVKISKEERQRLINRVRKNVNLFRGSRILWIDDFPESPASERRLLQSLLVDVNMVTSSAAAEKLLRAKEKKYDLILSDMKRDGDNQAGLKFLQNYAKQKNRVPVIFYIGYPDPTKPVPLNAFGITHRPDELLHLIMDALERVKD